MSDRRQFIKQSFLATAGVILANSPFKPLHAIGNNKCIVIMGAGFSGLAAACLLKEKGYEVTVLESRNRIGGRVFSHRLPENLTVELGAEWVGASHTRIQELCEQYQLKLLNNQLDTHLIYKGEYSPAGQWSYSKEWNDKLAKIISDFPHFTEEDLRKLDQYDWWNFLVKNGCQGRDLDIRELLDSTDFGESIRHVSAFSALAEYAESSEKNEMDLKIEGGNGSLAAKMAAVIGSHNILLQHRVSKVEQNGKVKITCENGNVFEADKVICTLPAFAIRQIGWFPGFSETQAAALTELQYARINKHVVCFKERFWKDESFDLITDETPHYFYHASKNQAGTQGALMSYAIGEQAAVFANRNHVAALQDIHHTLSPHFGDIRPLVLSQHNYYWGTDRETQGAYAMYGVNQWFRLRPILSKPHLHVHFAGEHLADWQGFMEGAVNSGEDAAREIIS